MRAFVRPGDMVIAFSTSGRSAERRRAGSRAAREAARRPCCSAAATADRRRSTPISRCSSPSDVDRADPGAARLLPARRHRPGRRVGGGRAVKTCAHDRKRAHRPGVAVAVAGGLPGGARDVPVGDRPDGGVPGLRLHLRLRRLLRVGRGERPGAVRADQASASPRAASRSSAAGGSSRTATCPSGESFVRQALYGQRYLRETFGITATTGANVDSFGHNAIDPADPAPQRRRLLRLPAAGPAGGRAREPALLVGVAGRLARPRLPDPERVPRAEGRSRRAPREGDRAAARADARSTRSSTASATTAAGRRRRTSTRSRG